MRQSEQLRRPVFVIWGMIGNENGLGLVGYGFEKSSFGCCASRQSKENHKTQELG